MAIDFHKDMNKYLVSNRRKKILAGVKTKMMNKGSIISNKAINKLGGLRDGLVSKVREIKDKGQILGEQKIKDTEKSKISGTTHRGFSTSKSNDSEEPMKEISVNDINNLVESNVVKKEKHKEIVEDIKDESEWKELRINNLEKKVEKKPVTSYFEEEKKKIEQGLAKMQEKKAREKERILKFNEENEERKRVESDSERVKRLELEDEIKILKEKQRIEEERLAELRMARRQEQMNALKGRVTDALFKKRHPMKRVIEGVKQEQVNEESKIEAKGVVEKPQIEENAVSEAKKDVSGESKIEEKVDIQEEKNIDDKKDEIKEKNDVKENPKKQRKSFLSSIIQIKTATQIAKEEEEKLKKEAEQALNDHSEINSMLEQAMGNKEHSVHLGESEGIDASHLFPQEIQQEANDGEEAIHIDDNYKIKVIRNS